MKPMAGRTVVSPAPTSGIGKQVAVGLAELGANLVLGCRDAAKGKALASELQRGADAPAIEVVQVDMAEPEVDPGVCDKHPGDTRPADVLINNAGVSRGDQPWARGVDGIELTFATNVIGYYLASTLLLPLLRKSAPARIVNVASTFASDLDLDDLEFQRRPYEGMKAYAQSKACDRLLSWALARRLAGTGVTVNAMAPGLIVDTACIARRLPT